MLDRRLALPPRVALRPEPFGALAYHYDTRKLVFLKHPDVVRVSRKTGAIYVTDHNTAVYAVILEPLGSVRIRALDLVNGTWQ